MASWRSLVYQLADLTLAGGTLVASTLSSLGSTSQDYRAGSHATAKRPERESYQAVPPSSTIDYDTYRFSVPGGLANSDDRIESSEVPDTYLAPSPTTPLSPIHSDSQPFTPLDEVYADDESVVLSTYEEPDGVSVVVSDNETGLDGRLPLVPEDPVSEDRVPVVQASRVRARTKGKGVWRPAQSVPQYPKRTTLPYIEFPSEEPLSKRAARRLKAKKRKGSGEAPEDDLWLESQSNSQEIGTDPTPGSSTSADAPHPEQVSLEERALDIYEKMYTKNERPRRPPRPPPVTPRFMLNTHPTPPSSPLSDRWGQSSVERAVRLPTVPNTFSSNRDPSPSPDDSEFPSLYESPMWRRALQPETTRQVNYSTWASIATTHQERWGFPVHRKIVNYSPCLICFDVPRQFPALRASSSCTHRSNVCAECLEQHIVYAVQSQGLTTVACPDPDCRREMEYGDVQRGAKNNQQCIDRYETLLLRRTLAKEPNFVWCKNPACEWGQVHESGAEAPIIICRYCRYRSCFTHDLPWHTGLTCEQYDARRATEIEVENDASQAYIEQHSKRCPSCRRPIEKTEGCDHMTCDIRFGCGHEFCWICLANYEPIIQEGNHHHNPTCPYYSPLPDPAAHQMIEEYFRQGMLELEGVLPVEVEVDYDSGPEWG